MIHLAERKIIVCEGLVENKAEVFLESAVIDVDRSWCVAEPAVHFRAF